MELLINAGHRHATSFADQAAAEKRELHDEPTHSRSSSGSPSPRFWCGILCGVAVGYTPVLMTPPSCYTLVKSNKATCQRTIRPHHWGNTIHRRRPEVHFGIKPQRVPGSRLPPNDDGDVYPTPLTLSRLSKDSLFVFPINPGFLDEAKRSRSVIVLSVHRIIRYPPKCCRALGATAPSLGLV